MKLKLSTKALPKSKRDKLLLACNILMAAVFIASGYSGLVRPNASSIAGTLAPMLNMAFPILMLMMVPVIAIDLYYVKQQTIIPLTAMVLTLGPILRICPLNAIPHSDERLNGSNTFKLVTYNICSYRDYTGKRSLDAPNPSLAYIIEQDADIVCLQEAQSDPWGRALAANVNQYDSIKMMYPYRQSVVSGAATLFSKEPVSLVKTPRMPAGSGVPQPFQVFMTSVKGVPLLVVNCHLQSIGLNNTDKVSFQQMTSGKINSSRMNVFKNSTFTKLARASEARAQQADSLVAFLKRHKGVNVIVCGDFNDVPGCWAARAIEKAGLTDAYAESGLGMTYTFNKNRLYFRIDHVFYKGAFRSIDIARGNPKSSDHYPLATVFEFDKGV